MLKIEIVVVSEVSVSLDQSYGDLVFYNQMNRLLKVMKVSTNYTHRKIKIREGIEPTLTRIFGSFI